MVLSFLLLTPDAWQRLRSPLAEAWRQRSFAPCRRLCHDLLPAAAAYAAHTGLNPADFLLNKVSAGLAFDRTCWRTLVGEALLVAAADVPAIETDPVSLTWLLTGMRLEEVRPPQQRSPIEQAHFGSRDLLFGSAFYRPDQAGYNDVADVVRLAHCLARIDPMQWQASSLDGLQAWPDPDEREEELAYLHERWRELSALYHKAHERRWLIVCEQL